MSKKERIDRVKKYGLCRKCLKSLKKVKHGIKQCTDPDCNDCQKDHHTLICLEEKKEQKVFKSEEEDEDDDSYVSDDKEAAKL